MPFTCEKPAYRVLYLVTFKFDGEHQVLGLHMYILPHLVLPSALGTCVCYASRRLPACSDFASRLKYSDRDSKAQGAGQSRAFHLREACILRL
jgi:hypothetical protein